MNRTALCIQMLMLLKSRDRISSKELAQMLNTNPRNIREFRKELEAAGYRIEEKRGRYGGYSLDDARLLPIPDLSADEIEDLGQIRNYLDTVDLALSTGSPASLLDKILAGVRRQADPSRIRYVKNVESQLSERQRKLIQSAKDAIRQSRKTALLYQKKGGEEKERRIVDPYEVYRIDGTWYLNGWDNVRQGFRNYRFSDQRMYGLDILEQPFIRDADYHLENYTGTHSARKSSMEKYRVRVSKKEERSFLELYWGAQLELTEENRSFAEYTFLDDEPWQVFSSLFFMGDAVKLLEPADKVKEFEEKIRSILQLYQPDPAVKRELLPEERAEKNPGKDDEG